MAHYAHVIKLHGGSAGAKSGNPEVALRHYRKVLENRINCIKAEIAMSAYHYQVPGTSIVLEDRPRWSGAFRANWNVQIGNEGKWASVLAGTQDRFPWKGDYFGAGYGGDHDYEYAAFIDVWKADKTLTDAAIAKMGVEEPIFIYNPSKYAKWLNDGGDDGLKDGTFKTYAYNQTGDPKWKQPALNFIGNGYDAVKADIDGIISRGLARAAKMKATG